MNHDIWNEKCVLSPSLICLDMCNLESQVRILEQAGITMLHVDILDGHFSPSMPLGLDLVRQLRDKTDMAFDCHVMVTEQDYFVDELLDIGVEQIVFHAETQPHIDGMLNRIHAKGVRAGVALKPATPLSVGKVTLSSTLCASMPISPQREPPYTSECPLLPIHVPSALTAVIRAGSLPSVAPR